MQADIRDAQDNKVMAILAYFGPLVLVPILAAKESRFARYHANQGLILAIIEVVWSILFWIITSIIISSNPFIVLSFVWTLISIIQWAGLIFMAVLAIIGIINANKGEMKPLPVIGGISILK